MGDDITARRRGKRDREREKGEGERDTGAREGGVLVYKEISVKQAPKMFKILTSQHLLWLILKMRLEEGRQGAIGKDVQC